MSGNDVGSDDGADFAAGPLPSPCIGVCSLDAQSHCVGCLRSLDEIARWMSMSDAERQDYLHTVLPARALTARLPEYAQLRRALYPLDTAPAGPGWNHAELIDLTDGDASAEAAVLCGLVPREQGTTVLLTRRTDSLRHHAGQVSFPGGRMEPSDADAAAAALRESCEEIALGAQQVHAIGYLDPFLTVSGFRVTPVVAVIAPGFVAVPQPDEVADVFEVPLGYLMDPNNLRSVELEFRGRPRRVLEYDWPAHRIWGATAAILLNLRRRLEQVA
ncbi:coenzyme A pyrophosphatase [Xanthomonas campestris pv. leeana]|uniref:CoA pyrophosphatase n=1 Tax=Xanthomonas citri TaxID=346 RepID=UPI000297DBB9|nr:CoA pyrophosphatase [Xanthomonas citri]EKQ63086.1 MutT-nudix family protein [Xanthomonas citri pv. malvacearum str. GSPB2388]OOW60341.1 coenzyme A pyrophosphatase [Xanthomonas campestris pv. thespesiae]OOW80314.1 coenzyme A pyrophosphatase [Xanthomonas campestris pv. leeana]